MSLELKDYQRRSLDELEAYLALVANVGAKRAFIERAERPYHPVGSLPDLPYVCLRVPTGGGKTLMACHSVGIAAQRYVQAEHAVCLWLVPSNVIRDQTLKALRHRSHPYRQALDARFRGQVEILNLTESLYVQRPVLAGATVVIVSTLAALRVQDTEGRKVYESAGALSHHFTGLTPELSGQLEAGEDGVLAHSLCNVLRLHRPLVIVDEAHNARTPLSFDTLARFNPSCIIEFTATPQVEHRPEAEVFASNVLCHVSALELKAEAMIKLPIELVTKPDWREATGAAVACQKQLETLATQEERATGEYLRPIVLLQAQPHSATRSTLDVETVQRTLTADCGVPEDYIAVATGQTREIDGVDLLARGCPVRFIITMQALKEGWDCPFAYVLCSVAEIGTGRAVEQILGRVLRMPHARRKGNDRLNRAYAFVASQRFADTANGLRDGLIENGFQRMEASDLVTAAVEQTPSLWGDDGLFAEVKEPVSRPPDMSALPGPLQVRLEWHEGEGLLGFTGEMTAAWREDLLSQYADSADQAAVDRLYRRSRGDEGRERVAESIATARSILEVPQLALRVDGELELFEDQHLDTDWRLSQCDPSLGAHALEAVSDAATAAELDVDEAGRVAVQFVEQVQEQLALLAWDAGWTTERLAIWLDRELQNRDDITQAESSLFIHNALRHLKEEDGYPLERLTARRFRLRDALQTRIDGYRRQHLHTSFQQLLFRPEAPVEVGPAVCFRLDVGAYAPNWYYEGVVPMRKHWHRLVGELAPRGEETDCAHDIDQHPQVKRWVRNLERRPQHSFWLPTSTDRFYPDFISELQDGRILVVEYKGEHLRTAEDAREKEAVGRLWAERSRGRCLFLMVTGPARPAIDALLAGGD